MTESPRFISADDPEWCAGCGQKHSKCGCDERTCARCGDAVSYLSSDDLCDGCVALSGECLACGSSVPDWRRHFRNCTLWRARIGGAP